MPAVTPDNQCKIIVLPMGVAMANNRQACSVGKCRNQVLVGGSPRMGRPSFGRRGRLSWISHREALSKRIVLRQPNLCQVRETALLCDACPGLGRFSRARHARSRAHRRRCGDRAQPGCRKHRPATRACQSKRVATAAMGNDCFSASAKQHGFLFPADRKRTVPISPPVWRGTDCSDRRLAGQPVIEVGLAQNGPHCSNQFEQGLITNPVKHAVSNFARGDDAFVA